MRRRVSEEFWGDFFAYDEGAKGAGFFFYPFRPSFLGKSNGALKSKSLDRKFKVAKYRIKIDGPRETFPIFIKNFFSRECIVCVQHGQSVLENHRKLFARPPRASHSQVGKRKFYRSCMSKSSLVFFP